MNKKSFITAGVLTTFTGLVLAGVFQQVNRPVAMPIDTVQSVQTLSAPDTANAATVVIDAAAQDSKFISAVSAPKYTFDEVVQANHAAPSKSPNVTAASITPAASATDAPVIQTAYSAQQAVGLAQNAASNASALRPAELVRYAGKVAYEVVFAQGHVYVDANTGVILSNGVAMANEQNRAYEGDEDDDSHSEEHHKNREGKKHKEHHDGDDDD